MNLQPPDKPLFSCGSVDVTILDKEEKCLGLVVHVHCWVHELESPSVKVKVHEKVKIALDYLVNEGFLVDVKGWNVAVAVMGHNPKESYE